MVLGELGNLPLWGVNLGHFVGGFGGIWGSKAIFLWVVDLGQCVGGFGWFGGLGGVRHFPS